MTELKPCPFCGGEVKIDRLSSCNYEGQTKAGATFAIVCYNCHFDFKKFTVNVTIDKNGDISVASGKKQAVKTWNKRVGEQDG